MKGFRYDQSSGRMDIVNGDYACPLFVGSAGRGAARNNPENEHVRATGPLPRGEYRMRVVPHSRFAYPAIKLEQVEGETFGRSAFYIHGGTESEGCILIQKAERSCIAAFVAIGYERLWVVE